MPPRTRFYWDDHSDAKRHFRFEVVGVTQVDMNVDVDYLGISMLAEGYVAELLIMANRLYRPAQGSSI